MDRRVVSPGGAPPIVQLSPGVRSGGLLFVSGQIAHEVHGFEAQTRAVLDKLGAILRAGGSDYQHVLRCGVYLADASNFSTMNEIYKTYFPTDPPARTTIECRLARPELLIEIDCVAACP